MNKKALDSYEMSTKIPADFAAEISEMEQNSEWIPDLVSKDLFLEAIEGPIFALDCANRYGMDTELMTDTSEGTKLLVDYYGQKYMVRDTARSSLGETAKLYGSALGRMEAPLMAATLNNGLSVARGKTLMLFRYGKASAFHSGGDGGYEVMPISRLLETAQECLSNTFGELEFIEGYNTHGYTTAMWALPDAQDKILNAYDDALSGAASRNFALNAMPGIRFTTSDTASSCACLVPVFLTGTSEYQLVDGLAVKHTKRAGVNGKIGMDLFADGAADMYAQFQASIEEVAKLANIRIIYGPNCVVSLCKRYRIPKMYGDAAREMVDQLTNCGKHSISAHDIYLAMREAVSKAKELHASQSTLNNLRESIAKMVSADWVAHDVGGVVAWND